MLTVVPVFGSGVLTEKMRIGFIVLFAYCLGRAIAPSSVVEAGGIIYSLLVIKECVIGIFLGLVCRFAIDSLQLAGEIIGQEMGFAMANIVDPVSEIEVTTLGQILYAIIILAFLSINGHHLFLRLLGESFNLIPCEAWISLNKLAAASRDFMKGMFFLSIKLAGPLFAFLFVLTTILAVMARTIPEVDILTVGFPARVAMGLFGMVVTMGYLMVFVKAIYREIYNDAGILFNALICAAVRHA